jgi:hypothetical protein
MVSGRSGFCVKAFTWLRVGIRGSGPSYQPPCAQFAAKQYSNPAPPLLTSLGWLQPREPWAEFQEALPPPVRSTWPTCTEPSSALLL